MITFTIEKVHSMSIYINSIFSWGFSDLVCLTGMSGNFFIAFWTLCLKSLRDFRWCFLPP